MSCYVKFLQQVPYECSPSHLSANPDVSLLIRAIPLPELILSLLHRLGTAFLALQEDAQMCPDKVNQSGLILTLGKTQAIRIY